MSNNDKQGNATINSADAEAVGSTRTILLTGPFGEVHFSEFLKSSQFWHNLREPVAFQDIWTENFKEKVMMQIQGAAEDLENPADRNAILNYFPTKDQLWEPNHKALAILCMKMLQGPDWVGKTQQWIRRLEQYGASMREGESEPELKKRR